MTKPRESLHYIDWDKKSVDFGEEPKQAKRPAKVGYYDGSSHTSVLFQMHGSVWRQVLPYCMFNVLVTYLIFLANLNGINLTMATTGHTFLSIMVSFLVVSRAQITYSRFMEARGYMSVSFRTCRELIQTVCCTTAYDTSEEAKQWRMDVAYWTIILLRVSMAAVEHSSTKKNVWELNDMPAKVREEIKACVVVGDRKKSRVMRWAHGKRSLSDENFRVPIIIAFKLRKAIVKQRQGGCIKERFHIMEELFMLHFVSDFITAFHGLKKLITTPFPFPLVQMARTILFFWVFTLPLVLTDGLTNPLQTMVIVFFITFGFMGLEYVSMELDDPFGDDPNDFDDLEMSQMVFEDIYVCIFKIDGEKCADFLRNKVVGGYDEKEDYINSSFTGGN